MAFIQCAGSRDRNHLKHCSRICCMATLKQTTYLREKFEDDFQASVYYIDIRAIDRIDDFYQKVQDDENVSFIKSKVASITEKECDVAPNTTPSSRNQAISSRKLSPPDRAMHQSTSFR